MSKTSGSRKATHHGHCQICGSFQLLPGGVLSLHGYTTRWGFFSGTCPGAGSLPFEQSINLIEAAIRRAEESAAALRENATQLRSDSTGNKTWVTVYDSATWKDRTSRTRWVEVELTETVRTESYGTVRTYTYTVESRDVNGAMVAKTKQFESRGYPQSLSEAVAAGREDRAKHLEHEATKYDSYVKWQSERIANWQPSALVARK